jgi:hypothetical protein
VLLDAPKSQLESNTCGWPPAQVTVVTFVVVLSLKVPTVAPELFFIVKVALPLVSLVPLIVRHVLVAFLNVMFTANVVMSTAVMTFTPLE